MCDFYATNRPEDYPDWDGDESIMWFIDNYEEDDECFKWCNDIEDEE